MPAIPRAYQKIFAGNYSSAPTGSLPVFGSLAASAIAWADDIPTITSLPAWMGGWAGAVVGTESPALEDFNALGYVVTSQLAYLFQAGIPEYDPSTTYYNLISFCTRAGVLYQSIQDNNTGNAPPDSSYWRVAFSNVFDPLGAAAAAQAAAQAFATSAVNAAVVALQPQLAKAWMTWNSNGFIYSSYGCSLVVNGTGDYSINFNTPFSLVPSVSVTCQGQASIGGTLNQNTCEVITGQVASGSFVRANFGYNSFQAFGT
jgi:hypothetical protein